NIIGPVLGSAPSPWEPSDDEILATLVEALDRPAFRTPFHCESSLAKFRNAIAETIATINAGTSAQGSRRVSKAMLRDESRRAKVDELVEQLVALRAAFERLLRDGSIQPCGCSNPDCPTFMLKPHAVHEMDRRRQGILRRASELSPRAAARFYDIG
ncbi:MAG: hypothetical protein ACREBE_29710, partial [bacterium]